MKEKISTQISQEIKNILIKYFDELDINGFIQNILEDILILTHINSFDRGGKNDSFSTGDYFTSKIRSIADRTITFAKDKLDSKSYFGFLADFGSLMITEGEVLLASEIFLNILEYSSGKNELNTVRANANLNFAKIYVRQAMWKEASVKLDEARKIYNDCNDKKGIAECDLLDGAVTHQKGDIQTAKDIFNNIFSYLDLEKDKVLSGIVELNLGNILDSEGKFDDALEYYENCLEKFEKLKDKRRIAEVRNNMGMVYIHKKKYEFALFEYDESIHISSEGRYLPILGIAYLNKALVYSEINEFKLSTYYANKAMDVCYQVNDVLSIADIYKIKGINSRKQFEYQLAEEYFKSSLRLNEELNNDLNYAETAFELGILYHELKAKSAYEYYFNKAQEYYKSINAEKKISVINEYLK